MSTAGVFERLSSGRHVTDSEARDKTRVLLTARAAVQSHSRGRVSPDKDVSKQGSRNRYGVTMTTSQKLLGKKKRKKKTFGMACPVEGAVCLIFFLSALKRARVVKRQGASPRFQV